MTRGDYWNNIIIAWKIRIINSHNNYMVLINAHHTSTSTYPLVTGKQMVADLTQRGVITTGAALTDVTHAPALDTARGSPLQARDLPKKESTQPVQKRTSAINSTPPSDEHSALVEGAEQLPMPEEVPLPDHSLNELQSRVAEFTSQRYREYPLPFKAKDVKKIPRTMLKPATHVGQ